MNDWLFSNPMRGKYQKNDQFIYDLFDPDKDVIDIWTEDKEASNNEFVIIYGIFQLDCTAEAFVRNCLRAHCAAHVINIFTRINKGNGSMCVWETLI